MSDLLLKIENASVSFDGVSILQDINLEVRKSDFIGVIGPNGGGKTTLVKLMLGLLRPDKGKIIYHLSHDTGNTKIGYLPQVHSFDKKFPITVQDVILSGLPSTHKFVSKHTGDEKEKAVYWMDRLGISSLSRKPIGNLSGGEMQRVFLCRSLISEPELLILDEPDTYVDNLFEKELYEELKELNHKMAVFLVSHDVGTITSYIKSIACVNKHLHHHPSNIITNKQLASYNCPVQIITHGDVPHTVLGKHDHKHDHEHQH
ncbi:MAG: zinc ABC transporter ATP-binding protein [Bacteroidetes bacterium]|nr:MAG: zinc ABC transporter ATP-binding protein [Bacteroidota bacterium]RLD81337.1 MAG: zinc ABC transporter ATP-binding protein [Bacteroidota bacterium]